MKKITHEIAKLNSNKIRKSASKSDNLVGSFLAISVCLYLETDCNEPDIYSKSKLLSETRFPYLHRYQGIFFALVIQRPQFPREIIR